MLAVAFTLAITSPPQALKNASVELKNGGLLLRIGGKEYDIEPPNPTRTGPYTVDYKTDRMVSIKRDGKELGAVDLPALQAKWFEDDALWGGHAKANQLRYQASVGAGVRPVITDIGTLSDRIVLGVVSFYNESESNHGCIAQLLVRLTFDPLVIAPLRTLAPPPIETYWWGTRRFFPFHGHALFYESQRLVELDREGHPKHLWTGLPTFATPRGIAEDRWLISLGDNHDTGHNENALNQSIVATDLFTRKSRIVVKPATSPNGDWSNEVYVSPLSQYLLIYQNRYSSVGPCFTAYIPDGRQQLIPRLDRPQQPELTVGPYAVGVGPTEIDIYSAITGNYLGALPNPKATKPKIAAPKSSSESTGPSTASTQSKPPR